MSGELTPARLPGRLTATGLDLEPGLSYERWVEVIRALTRMGNATAWAIADAVFYGQYEGYGMKYAQALELTGLSYQTLRNYAMVAGRFDPSRRRDKLSLQHHLEVAALPEREQDAWLDRAEAGGWSRDQLREAIVSSRAVPPRRDFPTRLTLEPNDQERELWTAAAAADGVDLLEWVREVLNSAAGAKAVIESR